MCLILFAHDHHSDYGLILAANRDEFFVRPTAPADFWEEAPDLLAGRDLQRGGTWMGVGRDGRWAAVTNFRHPAEHTRNGKSRGLLVTDFLLGDSSAAEYVQRLTVLGSRYRGFNLLASDAGGLFYASNRDGVPRRLSPGVYGLSNHLLDTPWPKVRKGKEKFAALLAGREIEVEDLFRLLADGTPAPEAELPDTGIGRDLESLLSPAFIRAPGYGTRSSSVLLLHRSGRAIFIERTFQGDTERFREIRREFPLAPGKS